MSKMIEIPKCACGASMIPSRKVPDVFVCINCDGVQDHEIAGAQRIKTPQDARFNTEMARRMKEWYPPKGKK